MARTSTASVCLKMSGVYVRMHGTLCGLADADLRWPECDIHTPLGSHIWAIVQTSAHSLFSFVEFLSGMGAHYHPR